MSLSPVKCRILEGLFLNEKPVEAIDIAKENKIDLRPLRMHLLGLNKVGYILSPTKGHYMITSKGKEALGIPATTRECARAILEETSSDKAFHFFENVGKPLNLYARGLKDFVGKIHTVNLASLEFHLNRGDFEAWFSLLGDAELSARMAMLKKVASREGLRERLREIVESRCTALSKLIESA